MAKAKATQAYEVTVKSPLWWGNNVAYPGDVVTHLDAESAAPLLADGYIVAVDGPVPFSDAPAETPVEDEDNN